MCGICGKIDSSGNPISQELIARMTEALSHRGPDDHGIYEHKGAVSVSLGHRRLSIVDLSPAGNQPLANEEKNIWLVFNGEIYNHLELRRTLESKGHRFSSQTDSEVILHLYEDLGIHCLQALNGMFAFCLWDSRTQTAYLCRDRAGIKPLLYAWDGHALTFASEIRSLIIDPSINTEIDHDALDLYLSLNYIPSPYTIYKGIKKLNPGSFLMFNNKDMRLHTYWDPKPSLHTPFNFEDAKKQLYALVEESIGLQCKADVPLGAFLSGGIDSSIIVGLMSKMGPVKTFSVGFEDMPLLDETPYALAASRHFHTHHTPITLRAKDVQDVFTDLLSWFDEPFADSSAIPTFIVARETRKHVKVAISGDGGDELFAGYRMYTGEYWHSYYRQMPYLLRRALIEPLVKIIPDSRDHRWLEQARRIKKMLGSSAETIEGRYFLLNEIFPRMLRKEMYKNPPPSLDKAYGIIRDLFNTLADPTNRMLYCDFKNALPNDMLFKVDAMSMKNSLEVRVPLLDHRLIEWAFQIEGDFKLHKTQGKHILRETFKDLLPPSIVHRKKSGFEIPISRWLKTDLKFLVEEHLSKVNVNQQGIFNYATIKNLIDDLYRGRRDTSWQIWNLIVFAAWFSRERQTS